MAINESDTAKETFEKMKKDKIEKIVGETFPVIEDCVNLL